MYPAYWQETGTVLDWHGTCKRAKPDVWHDSCNVFEFGIDSANSNKRAKMLG